MANYDNISGVGYRRFTADGDEPETEQHDAKVEELYFSHGHLEVRVETDDGFISIDIPILPVKKWNKFVDSLPQWNE